MHIRPLRNHGHTSFRLYPILQNTEMAAMESNYRPILFDFLTLEIIHQNILLLVCTNPTFSIYLALLFFVHPYTRCLYLSHTADRRKKARSIYPGIAS